MTLFNCLSEMNCAGGTAAGQSSRTTDGGRTRTDGVWGWHLGGTACAAASVACRGAAICAVRNALGASFWLANISSSTCIRSSVHRTRCRYRMQFVVRLLLFALRHCSSLSTALMNLRLE